MQEEALLKLTIDKNQLDEEWLLQPEMMHTWARKAADAQFEVDEAKAKLALLESQLYGKIRDNPEEYDLPEKLTEKLLEHTVNIQPEKVQAVAKLNRARHTLSIMQAAVNSLEHRKRALTLLVELWTRDYYSNPNMNPNTEATENFDRKVLRRRGIMRDAEEQDTD